jgi:hypothetical protein
LPLRTFFWLVKSLTLGQRPLNISLLLVVAVVTLLAAVLVVIAQQADLPLLVGLALL